MKGLIVLLLVSATAWAVMDDTWATGEFAGETENYTIADAVVVYWPQMGVQKNVLEVNLFTQKLSLQDRKAYIEGLAKQKVEDVQRLFDGKNAPPKPRYLSTTRLQLSFYYQTPPSDFASARVSSGGSCIYLPSGGFIGSMLPISTSFKFSYSNGVSHNSTTTKLTDGLQLKITGQNRAGELINFQSEFHPRKKDTSEAREYKVQVITPLVVCNL